MKLIINADDVGIDRARNEGIFQCVDHGVVSSLSVIVAQAGWQDALARLRARARPTLCIGLHFNLTAGRPLVRGHKTLIGPDGFFLSKSDLWQKAKLNLIDEREAAQELTAQLAMLRKEKIEPTHIDGHNHVHILPAVREAVYKVVAPGMWVRLPWERNIQGVDPKGESPLLIHNNTERLIAALNFYSGHSQSLWANRFRYTDDFRGTRITPQVTLSAFKQAISELRGEMAELMCHPGGKPDNQAQPFSRLKERDIETQILISEELKIFLQERGIKIAPFTV